MKVKLLFTLLSVCLPAFGIDLTRDFTIDSSTSGVTQIATDRINLSNPFVRAPYKFTFVPQKPTNTTGLCLNDLDMAPGASAGVIQLVGRQAQVKLGLTQVISPAYDLPANTNIRIDWTAAGSIADCQSSGDYVGGYRKFVGKFEVRNLNDAIIWEEDFWLQGTLSASTCDWPASLLVDVGEITSLGIGRQVGSGSQSFTLKCSDIIQLLPRINIDATSKVQNYVTGSDRQDYGIAIYLNSKRVNLGGEGDLAVAGATTIEGKVMQLEPFVSPGEIDAVASVTLTYN